MLTASEREYFTIRPYIQEDRSFIFTSFISSLGKNHPWDKLKNKHVVLNTLMDKYLNEHECLVVCDNQDPEVLYGFMVYRKSTDTIFYTYVKYSMRRLGLATYMVDSVFPNDVMINYPHETFATKKMTNPCFINISL